MSRDGPIIKADRGLQKRWSVLTLVLLAVAGVGLYYFQTYMNDIQDLAQRDREAALAKLLFALRVTTAVGALPLIAFGIYVLRLAGQVVRARRFPPPGRKVIRDTRLIVGHAAKTRGVVIAALGIVLVAGGAAIPFIAHRLAQRVAQSYGDHPPRAGGERDTPP